MSQNVQNSQLYILQNQSYCRLKLYILAIGHFVYFLENRGKYYNFPFVVKTDTDDAETHFLAHY